MTTVSSGEKSVPLLSGLTATPTLKGVQLDWDDLYDDEYQSAVIYRYTSDTIGSAVEIGRAKNATQYLDNTVTAGETYYYWVRASNVYGQENGSYEPAVNGVSVTALQAATEHIEAAAVSTISGAYETSHESISAYSSYETLTTLNFTTPNITDGFIIECAWQELTYDISISVATGEVVEVGYSFELYDVDGASSYFSVSSIMYSYLESSGTLITRIADGSTHFTFGFDSLTPNNEYQMRLQLIKTRTSASSTINYTSGVRYLTAKTFKR